MCSGGRKTGDEELRSLDRESRDEMSLHNIKVPYCMGRKTLSVWVKTLK